jgi:hypothetical protein
MADALAVSGVQVRQQIARTPPDGAPRAEAALWLPDVDGTVQVPDARAVPARVQVALVVDPHAKAAALQSYDGLVVVHAALAQAVGTTLKRAGGREPPIHVARLPHAPVTTRDAEKALRGVRGRRVAVVDVRQDFEGDIERVVVQLGLRAQDAAAVLLVPHEERARTRVRSLCARHAVDAWITSGTDAVASTVAAADVFVGAPSWDELCLLAARAVEVVVIPDAPAPFVQLLAEARLLDDRHSVLQLAATLDRKLSDPGALDARGTALQSALCGPESELLEALGSIDPLPDGIRATQWEAVGPHAIRPTGTPALVDAKDTPLGAGPSPAERIEEQLHALKERIALDQKRPG